jgi:hypothetical protein
VSLQDKSDSKGNRIAIRQKGLEKGIESLRTFHWWYVQMVLSKRTIDGLE